MQRLLFALALLSCSAAASAGAPKSGADTDTQQCTPVVAETDCDSTQANAAGNPTRPAPMTNNDAARRPQQRRPARVEPARNTLRFQSFLPGMIR